MTTSTPILLHEAVVTKQQDYGNGYFVTEFACPELAASIGIGQFINIRIRGEMTPLLRRPFSVFDVFRDAKGRATGISILYHTVGVGTRLMSKWQAGDKVSINGPLGQAYPEPADKGPKLDTVIMVGGGIGLAPFLLQAKRWQESWPERTLVLIAGGRSDRDLRYMNLFQPMVAKGLNLVLCTNDGSLGIKGMVTDPLRGELEGARAAKLGVTIYTCGPTPMMAAVAAMAHEFEVPAIASLENVMACGYGVCNGCVTSVADASVAGGRRFAKTCIEGPAFDCEALQWA